MQIPPFINVAPLDTDFDPVLVLPRFLTPVSPRASDARRSRKDCPIRLLRRRTQRTSLGTFVMW